MPMFKLYLFIKLDSIANIFLIILYIAIIISSVYSFTKLFQLAMDIDIGDIDKKVFFEKFKNILIINF